MAITLTYGAEVLVLPDALIWDNEFRWSAVSQSAERSITGALLLDVATRTGGRQIVLRGDEDTAWIQRSGLLTLLGWAAIPGQEFTLTHNGIDRQVVFNHGTQEESQAIRQVQPVVDFSDPEAADHYCRLELNFLEI